MKFVAPEQAPEQAEIIRNTPFWPDVDLSEFRSVMRTDGTVTQPRLKQVALSAISEVNAELYEFRRRQQMLGYTSLAEVPAEQLDGKSERIQHYFNAVYCWARAMLNERYQDYDATASGVKRGEELAEASGDLWRDARWAISRVTEIMRLITNLIRTGVVTEVDRENWLCRVKTGDLETNWISWLTLRAGNARTWWRPSEGEQVVLLSLGGNLETAFALPSVYSNQFAPPSTSADACVTEHPDGGWFEYEPATGRWYIRGIKSMVIEAADNITLKTSEFVLEADRTRINSEVVINGGVTQGGGAMSSNGIVVDVHQHTGVLKGGDTTGGPV
ncbi:phage baseplate assembly protein V [Escherichia coli]|nr:phage baseplate assembly protein V [Escherichia coli]MGR23681.1 phage baseplate assembly protein V [Escherichia coli]